jgi:iron complex outermembrane receptor protein
MRRLLLGTTLAIVTPATLAAQATYSLDETEVAADRVSEAEQRAPTAFSSVIDVPSRDVPIETTADVLSESVGVHVQRYGGLGAFSTISIRGSTAAQVPVYLDGVPLSQAQDQTVNLSDLPLDSLQRIEVYRGTVPVGFGGGGIGGVVNLVTRPPSEDPLTEVNAGYGSFDTRKLVATHARKIGATGLLAHVSYLGSDGDFPYLDDRGTPENSSDDVVRTRANNHFDAIDGLFKGAHDFGEGLVGDLVQEVFVKTQGVPGPGTLERTDASLHTVRSLSYARLRQSGWANDAIDLSGTLYGVYGKQEFVNATSALGALQATYNQTALAGGSTNGTWMIPYHQTIGWFAELAYEQFFPFNTAAEPEKGPDQTRLRATFALQDEIRLLHERIVIVPSVRYDHFRDDFSPVDLANNPESDPHTNDLDLWTPAIGAEGRIAPWLALRGNFGRYERAPNFNELFGNSGSVLGNASLEPETGMNRDIGFVLTWPQRAWIDAGRIEYAYFNNEVDNLIVFEAARAKSFRAMNAEKARIAGHELGVSVGVLDHLGLDLNYTHQDSKNPTIDSAEGNQLPLRPADELFVRPRLFNRWGSLYYEYTYLSDDPIDPHNFEVVPPRSIHTIGCSVQPLPWLTARFEAVNITDADIRDVGDFPLPGLSFFGGLKATF